MNELKEIIERLERQWDSDGVHFDTIYAQKNGNGSWSLTVVKREEKAEEIKADEEGGKAE